MKVPADPRYSVKVERQNFDRVLKERTPAVEQASRALQDAIGIKPGTKTLGNILVRLWELPEPPKDTVAQSFARLEKNLIEMRARRLRQYEQEEDSEDELGEDKNDDGDDTEGPNVLSLHPGQAGATFEGTDDDADNENIDRVWNIPDKEAALFEHVEFGDEKHQLDTAPKSDVPQKLQNTNVHASKTKRKLEESPPSQAQHPSSTTKKPKIVIDLTNSPPTGEVKQRMNPFQQQTAAPKAQRQSAPRPASPPPYHHTPPRAISSLRRAPVYWNSELSRGLVKWLEQSETKSTQAYLSHLELRSTTTESDWDAFDVGFNINDYPKIKVSRIVLPAPTQLSLAAPKPLDWLVIEVGFIPESEMLAIPPYFLLAFPAQAVTASTLAYCRSPLEALSHGRLGHKKASKKKTTVEITTLFLGKQGMVPVMHGRDITKKIADEFIQACAKGEGVIVLKSLAGESLKDIHLPP